VFGKKRKFRALYLFIFVPLIFFLLNRYFFSFSNLFSTVASSLSYPVLLVQKKITTPIRFYFSKRSTRKSIEQLLFDTQKENKQLRAHNTQLCATLDYHNDIAELIEFKKRYDCSDSLVAQIIFRQINDQNQFVFLDKGSRHGVVQDMVAVYKNNLLGKITDVYPFYSKLVLLSDRSCKVAAYCAPKKKSGIHTGQNNCNCAKLERVSHLANLKEGDLLLSSGEGLIFPRGFALGKISSVRPDGLYLSVTVKPLVDINNLQHCCLIKKGEATIV